MASTTEIDAGAPRGTKRKAEEALLSAEPPRRIRALDQDVVDKIAAGEIIVAPVHALKELIENAVDAGSTALEIVVKDGGLKLLQLTDNGHGINRDDLSILCERFTTSKLKAFEDLASIGTYGFRGEALASISHIAHLTVTTKTKDSSCAWKAHYSDGKLAPPKPGQSADPKATAGRQGTQITVEDLFYNIPTRRRTFRSASEEYAKILDVVGRYAVHCSGVAFTCKKHGDSNMGLSVPATASTVDRIRQIHGNAVAAELIQFQVESERWGFKSEGWTSNANYSVKRTALLLFINHRSVESLAIKKAVEQTYSAFLPKGGHPFVYLSLEIEPHRVDVNVHPTKREVNFLNEDEIIEVICDEIRASLGKVDTSRTFMTQSLLPGRIFPKTNVPETEDLNRAGTAQFPTEPSRTPGPGPGLGPGPGSSRSKGSAQKIYENNVVRTDSKVRKITAMLPPRQIPSSPTNRHAENTWDEMDYEYSDKPHKNCRLISVKELRAEVRENMHNELTEVFASHTFVGIVDEQRRIAAIQGGVKLYLVDYGMICNEYFYQVGVTDFANFGSICFEPALRLRDLLSVGAAHEKAKEGSDPDSDLDWDEVVNTVEDQLLHRRTMLAEYFALHISAEGELISLPLLIKGYMPSMAKLPQFLLRLGPYVDWNQEKACFHDILKELASFYVPEALPTPRSLESGQSAEEPDIASRRAHLDRAVENTIFPAFKARLIATKGLLSGVVEVANLKGLYRVFERC